MKTKKRNSYNILSTIVLTVAALTVIFPLLWVAFTSLKSSQEFYFNIWGLPKEFVWKNYVLGAGEAEHTARLAFGYLFGYIGVGLGAGENAGNGEV